MNELQYQLMMLKRNLREFRLRLFGVNRMFYCQREIEGESKCINQCSHCKEYYKELDNNLLKQ